MKLDLRKNFRRNMIAGVINRGMMMLFPFLNRTLFLWLLGPEYLGLNGLFGSVLGVLSLAELGFGAAVVCSMYEPIAKDDRERLCAFLAFYRRVYRIIGLLVAVVGLSLLPFLRSLVHGSVPSDISLQVIYLVHLVNTVLGYWLFAYRSSLLSAYQREDVLTHIRTGVTIAQYLTTFLILWFTRSYLLYVLATVVFTIVTNVLIAVSTRRLFPELNPSGSLDASSRARVIDDVKAIFLHKIGTVVSYNADNLVISAILGLVAVGAYGNYYYVYTTVGGFVYILYNSLTAGFGNTIRTESVAENYVRFMRANRISLLSVSWCSAMMLALYGPFMQVWVGDRTELVRHFPTVLLMVLYFYVNYSRQMLLTFKSAAGLWREDRWKPLVAAIVNLALNLTMIRFWDLDGVILSTIIAFLVIEIPWEARVLFRHYFDRDAGGRVRAREYIKFQLGEALLAIAVCALAYIAASFVPGEGFVALVMKGVAAAMVASVFTFVRWVNMRKGGAI